MNFGGMAAPVIFLGKYFPIAMKLGDCLISMHWKL